MNSPKPFALIICNGEMPRKKIITHLLKQNPFIICADGGANAAKKLGLVPDVIIGDFDSMNDSVREFYLQNGKTKFIHLRRQSDTDFEKALKLLVRKHFTRVIVIGATGKFTDHTFGNFSILMRYTNLLNTKFIDAHFMIEKIEKRISFTTRIGSRISLIPFPVASGIRTKGLKYQLNDEELKFGDREGTCNVALKKNIFIEVKRGTLFLFRSIENNLENLTLFGN